MTRPPFNGSSPARMRSVVVLPEPDGPSSAKNSPGSMSRSMPCSTVTAPWRLTMPRMLTSAGSFIVLTAFPESSAAALDGTDGQPLDDVTLREQPQHDHGRHREQRTRRQLRPQRLLDGDEVEHCDGHGPHPVAAEHDGEQELV